jgi:hypothetical protein
MDKATAALFLSGLAIAVTATLGVAGYLLQRRVAKIEVDRRVEQVEARMTSDVMARLEPPGDPTRLVLSGSGGCQLKK